MAEKSYVRGPVVVGPVVAGIVVAGTVVAGVAGTAVVGPVVLGATVGAVTAESGDEPALDVLSDPEQAAVRSMPTTATATANERVRMPAA